MAQSPDAGPPAGTTSLSLQLRHHLLYRSAPLSFQATQNFRQFQQILDTKQRPTRGYGDKRVRRRQTRPTCWNRSQMAVCRVEIHPVLTPVAAVLNEVKFFLEQRMMRMSYPKMSPRIVAMRCS